MQSKHIQMELNGRKVIRHIIMSNFFFICFQMQFTFAYMLISMPLIEQICST